ncbi:MAG: Stealth CR1 domain-containing protein [Rikenellaceae bacterium]|nr:Stealth CR1 domain-containing protein [Rikenellaceae bacterium]
MKRDNSIPNFPIDLVYMWVDGNDPKWQAKRNQYLNVGGDFATQGQVAARWVESDELRYSLRSVEMYAPWINRIFIVTDSQCPSWLNVDNPKVRVIDHSEIIPTKALPVFNSTAIESCIYKIPELSEHFILGNDDTLFCSPVAPNTFFKADGTPIVRLLKAKFKRKHAVSRGNYNLMVKRMQDLITQKFGKKIYHAPHHNFDAYRKSDFEYCVSLMRKEWESTSLRRFRHDEDMHRSFVSYYMIASGGAELHKVNRYNRISGVFEAIHSIINNSYATDSRCTSIACKDYEKMLSKYNPTMLCLNDGEGCTDEDRERMVEFLKRKYPDKSSFEK